MESPDLQAATAPIAEQVVQVELEPEPEPLPEEPEEFAEEDPLEPVPTQLFSQLAEPPAQAITALVQNVRPAANVSVTMDGLLAAPTAAAGSGQAAEGIGEPMGDIIFDISELDQKGREQIQPQAVYPPSLQNQGIEGEVEVRAVIGLRGEVEELDILRADHPEFRRAAVSAMRRAKFSPGLRGGQPVRFVFRYTFEFNLPD